MVANGCQDGIGGIAGPAGEVVASHSVLDLEVADHRLDGGASAQLAADHSRDTAFLA